MFTAIILFIAIFLAIIISLLDAFKFPILVFFILLIILIAIKTIRQVKKYGRENVFSAFKEKQMPFYQHEIIKQAIRKHKGYRYIHPMHNCFSDYLIIDQSGVYLLKVLEYSGTIQGKIDDASLVLKNSISLKIINFFHAIDQDKMAIQKICGEFVIPILVKKDSCVLQVVYPKKYIVINFKNFYYSSETLFSKTKYSQEQVDEIYKKIIELSQSL